MKSMTKIFIHSFIVVWMEFFCGPPQGSLGLPSPHFVRHGVIQLELKTLTHSVLCMK